MGLIRFLLAMAVVAAHSAPVLGLTLVGGKIAVQSFFVISGFYISLILNEKYPAGTRGTLLFYGNRFLRIYPIYWAILLLTAGAGTAVLLLFGWHSFVSNVSSLTKGFAADKLLFLIASNVGILGIDLSSFMRFDLPHLAFTANWTAYKPQPSYLYLVPQAWSLSIEILVYAIAPFLFRRSIGLLAALLIASFAARTVAYDAGLKFDPWDYRFFPFEFGLFVTGSLLYRAYRSVQGFRIPTVGWTSLVIGVTGILLYPLLPQITYPVVGFPCTEVVFLAAFSLCIPGIFALSKNWRIDRWLGELSYPIYLCHLFVIMACNGRFGWGALKPAIGTVLLAAVLTVLLEIPLDRLRQRRFKQLVGSAHDAAYAKPQPQPA
jgi:peptidoglycan/LPS O-acetylase OafA/YrhL